MKIRTLAWPLIALLSTPTVSADWVEARCDIYPRGEDHASAVLPCTFGQRQGHVAITRADGVSYAFSPEGDMPGNFIDDEGNAVYRQSGLGRAGLIFRMRYESGFVYWSASARTPAGKEGPFHGEGYDATTRLRCGIRGRVETWCAAGIVRSGPSTARIDVDGLSGERLVLQFAGSTVDAGERDSVAKLKGDTWELIIDGRVVFEVPLAAIDGG
jgi:hypothetical protein